jgi:hypothetical protein
MRALNRGVLTTFQKEKKRGRFILTGICFNWLILILGLLSGDSLSVFFLSKNLCCPIFNLSFSCQMPVILIPLLIVNIR